VAEIIDFMQIQKILPHRYPFLLVDRVVSFEPGVRIDAYKNVTGNEEFFNGHFPGHPVMPGVLILEALAQSSAVLAYRTEAFDMEKQVIYLAGIDGARFKRPVRPGDRLDLHARIDKRKGPLWRMVCEATVDGQKAAEATMLATLADR
jgi:3-hydroxyacyl-[acyl-carrier-protein] dehydratase